jgi:flagellar hook-basal body complex protein FliE
MIPALSLVSSILGASPTGSVSELSGQTGSVTKAGASFGEIFSQVSTDMIDRLKVGEATSISGLQGKASAQNVVESVMGAQQSLQTAIAIRDKVVSAYQSISQMAI